MLRLNARLSGKFIVLDGPDGCGKSTQARLLAEWVQEGGVEAVSFRDPGTTEIGEEIRHILLNPANVAMGTRTELLLYMAARAQLWEEKIKPALGAGKCVVLDRWLSSTCAYQGYAGGYGMERIIRMAADSLERVWPDVTVVLDVDIEIARPRLNAELDRMERKGADYHRKVREGFLELAKGRADFEVVDASKSIEEVHKRIVEVISGRI